MSHGSQGADRSSTSGRRREGTIQIDSNDVAGPHDEGALGRFNRILDAERPAGSALESAVQGPFDMDKLGNTRRTNR